ncbi:MAG: cardiolipin synthase ClsB [Burkholderiaceae bacterium]
MSTVESEPVSTDQDVSLAWYRSLTPELRNGHDIKLLCNGQEYFPALAAEIESAQETVSIETYMFNDDVSGQMIAQALVDAAERGVMVQCVVDGFGTPKLKGQVARLMAHPDIQFETFRPERFRFSLDRQRLRRLHRKLAVIDARVAYVGGINLVDDWYDPNHGKLEAPRLDFAIRVLGPLVANANLAVQRLWWELSIVNRSLLKPRPGGSQRPMHDPFVAPRNTTSTITAVGQMRAMLVVRDNLRHRRTIERWYLRSIENAQREIIIANAYFLPGVRFRRALKDACQRGVRVRLLLQGKVEYQLQHLATQALYDELLAVGIEVYEYLPSFLHAKVAVIDDQATVGSSNIDPFSLLLAREANVMIDDPGFATRLRDHLETAMVEGSNRFELQSHRQRPWWHRVQNWFSFVLLRLAVSVTGQGADY